MASNKRRIQDPGNKSNRQKSSQRSPFDELALEYDAWFDNEGRFTFDIEVSAFMELLPSLPQPWLEIGVGSGRFAQALGIATGLDPSLQLAQMARRRGINTILGQGEKEPFDDQSFGTVFLIVTLCFLDSPLNVLKEANRILIPDGKIVLGLVLRESPWGEAYQRQKNQGHRFYKHATFYTHDEVIALLTQAGFVTERIISTIFQKPGTVCHREEPREGYFPEAGFTIIMAGKHVS